MHRIDSISLETSCHVTIWKSSDEVDDRDLYLPKEIFFLVLPYIQDFFDRLSLCQVHKTWKKAVIEFKQTNTSSFIDLVEKVIVILRLRADMGLNSRQPQFNRMIDVIKSRINQVNTQINLETDCCLSQELSNKQIYELARSLGSFDGFSSIYKELIAELIIVEKKLGPKNNDKSELEYFNQLFYGGSYFFFEYRSEFINAASLLYDINQLLEIILFFEMTHFFSCEGNRNKSEFKPFLIKRLIQQGWSDIAITIIKESKTSNLITRVVISAIEASNLGIFNILKKSKILQTIK